MLYAPVLNYIANELVYRDKVIPSDAIVVLTGDGTGERLMAGMSLFKRGMERRSCFGEAPFIGRYFAELFLRQLKENGIGPESASGLKRGFFNIALRRRTS